MATLGTGIIPGGAQGTELSYITRRAYLPSAIVQIYQSSPLIAALMANMQYDTERDLTPITLLASAPNMLVVNLDLPAKTVPELIELAKAKGGRIIVPTGALLGLDAVSASAEGIIHSVKMTTRKPPIGLKGAPYLVQNNISVDGLNEAKLVFSGTAREAAAGFPANVNVAAALSLAGIGPDRTMIDIYADPAVTRNCHSIEVDSDSARFTLSIENIPSGVTSPPGMRGTTE